jgi:2,4-dienoyl-CoA reductase-like NADH-dependent reductase (Old Yellow Enzyme family)
MRLFEPITIRGMTLKNRIVFPPMGNGRGLLGQRSRSYYVERARGRAGAIFTTGVLVDLFASDESWGKPGGVAEFIENVRSLPDMVHKAGAKIGVQLVHLNRLSFGLSPGGARGQPIAPSARVEPNPTSLFLDPEEEMLRELTVAEIETIVAKFGRAASRVREAGFDFVEFHSAHGYLACQFLLPILQPS